MSEEQGSADTQSEERIITSRPGPVIRLATVCESIIEEAGTHTSTVVRMLDGVQFSDDDVAEGDTYLSGYIAFMGYDFPGDGDEADVTILFATGAGAALGGIDRRMRVHAIHRAFAIANRLDQIRIPEPGEYVFALVHQDEEIARAYLTAQFGAPAPLPDEDDQTP